MATFLPETRNAAISDLILRRGRFLSRLIAYVPAAKWLYSVKALRRIQAIVQCEAHHEALVTILSHGTERASKNWGQKG